MVPANMDPEKIPAFHMDAKYDCESGDRQVGLSLRRPRQGTAQGGRGVITGIPIKHVLV